MIFGKSWKEKLEGYQKRISNVEADLQRLAIEREGLIVGIADEDQVAIKRAAALDKEGRAAETRIADLQAACRVAEQNIAQEQSQALRREAVARAERLRAVGKQLMAVDQEIDQALATAAAGLRLRKSLASQLQKEMPVAELGETSSSALPMRLHRKHIISAAIRFSGMGEFIESEHAAHARSLVESDRVICNFGEQAANEAAA